MSDFLSAQRLWEFLLVCERTGLITFNYPSEQLKAKINQCLIEAGFCDQSPIHNECNEGLGPESQYQTPPISCPCPPPAAPPTASSVAKYRIIGEIPLTEDRRKTTFNFNISLSDDESEGEGVPDGESLCDKDEIMSNGEGNNSRDHMTNSRQSHDDHITNSRQSHDDHMTNSRQSHDDHITNSRQSHDDHMTNSRQSHDDHMTNSRQSHDDPLGRNEPIGNTLNSSTPPYNHTHHEYITASDNEDEKLESLFSHIKLHSEKKITKYRKIVSRESLEAFIVSDSEEISDEESFFPKLLSPVNKYPPPLTGSPGVCFTPVTQIRTHPKQLTRFTTPSANKSVKRNRRQMSQELFDLFNRTVFENKLPEEMEVIWNNRLRTTAGYCAYLGSINCRTARIELSTKVCDTYDRIRDTLIHEMCHVATWIIDGVRRAGHGPMWKAWGQKANQIYPDLTPVSRCHAYEISYKYTYQCSKCDFKIGRHSKSLNLQTARCPYCTSSLELLY